MNEMKLEKETNLERFALKLLALILLILFGTWGIYHDHQESKRIQREAEIANEKLIRSQEELAKMKREAFIKHGTTGVTFTDTIFILGTEKGSA